MKEKVLKVLKIVGYVALGFVGISIVVVPYIMVFTYLKKQNKKVTLYPELNIVSVTNTLDIPENVQVDLARLATEGLQRLKEVK